MKYLSLGFFVVMLTTLLATDASAYRPKAFRIQVIGAGEEKVTFAGWCDIEIGNRTLNRNEFQGINDQMEPLEIFGQYIDSCEVRNLSGDGTITLILYEKEKEIYRNTTTEGASKISFGPTMQRYSTRPPTLNQQLPTPDKTH